jgi:2-dehydro-3-deoxy-D-arabinonate dehydratase
MKIYKLNGQAVIENDGLYYSIRDREWDALMNRKGLHQALLKELKTLAPSEGINLSEARAPIGSQEIWAAGVTYLRSREARMEESRKSGGGSFYDKVYEAVRPELFFKAMAHRTAGPGDKVNIRKDSKWDVPEPELTLWISSEATIEGYTIGNDMSSRSIEGENPLYLPQAKVYDRCAGLGPCVYVPGEPLSPDIEIELEIRREGARVFHGKLPISQMKRKHTELVEFLFRECDFPHGCYLMTGTGIVPPDDFTLRIGDEIRITIAPIGTLVNYVGQK